MAVVFEVAGIMLLLSKNPVEIIIDRVFYARNKKKRMTFLIAIWLVQALLAEAFNRVKKRIKH